MQSERDSVSIQILRVPTVEKWKWSRSAGLEWARGRSQLPFFFSQVVVVELGHEEEEKLMHVEWDKKIGTDKTDTKMKNKKTAEET
jgi:hypothetical protein